MVCIFCGSPAKTQVTNSRLQKRPNQVWRRRHCPSCGQTFTTEEAARLDRSLSYTAANGKQQPFIQEKLFLSLYNSLAHRPQAAAEAASLCQTVVAKLLASVQDGSIDRVTVVQTTAAVLRRFDRAAASSYLAYHPKRSLR